MSSRCLTLHSAGHVESQVQFPISIRNPKRRRVLFVVGVLIASVTLVAYWKIRHKPLTVQERQLIGDWYWDNPQDTRRFTADREFSTSDGQFMGVWDINDGKLTLTYWQPFQSPSSIRPSEVVRSVRHTAKEIVAWNIDFSDNKLQHVLSVAVSEAHPDGKWMWSRVPAPPINSNSALRFMTGHEN